MKHCGTDCIIMKMNEKMWKLIKYGATEWNIVKMNEILWDNEKMRT